jgi:hypothetical protein
MPGPEQPCPSSTLNGCTHSAAAAAAAPRASTQVSACRRLGGQVCAWTTPHHHRPAHLREPDPDRGARRQRRIVAPDHGWDLELALAHARARPAWNSRRSVPGVVLPQDQHRHGPRLAAELNLELSHLVAVHSPEFSKSSSNFLTKPIILPSAPAIPLPCSAWYLRLNLRLGMHQVTPGLAANIIAADDAITSFASAAATTIIFSGDDPAPRPSTR